jgi:phosphoglycerate kinase
MAIPSVKSLDIQGKRVLVREDFNVPLTTSGEVADDTRLRASLPTIELLVAKGAAVILLSHLGRPKGGPDPKLTLRPVADRLEALLHLPVQFMDDCVGPAAEAASRALQPGEILLAENVRFHPEEEANDLRFARQLAALGDVYVNDAFGTAHRAHASTEGVAHLLPHAAGLLMERELTMLGGLLEQPKRPFAAIIGGSKVSTKLAVLDQLVTRVDVLILGGGMANTFLKAQGTMVGTSLVEDSLLDEARRVLTTASRHGVQVVLPTDVVVAERFAADAAHKVVKVAEVPAGWTILDLGPDSVQTIRTTLSTCATVLWNGPLGVFEMPAFATGTLEVAHMLAELPNVISVVGGGESVEAIEQAGVASRITHVSTGGGASLELLEGRTLPGVAALAS